MRRFGNTKRIVDPKYLDEIRAAAKQFSTKLLSRKARVADTLIRKEVMLSGGVSPGQEIMRTQAGSLRLNRLRD
jgi:hypothetical protein